MPSRNLFWDTCVFVRWLTGIPEELVADIAQYIEDAKAGRLRIHYSTITLAEIRPSLLKPRHKGSVARLFADLGSAFSPIDPNPNIMLIAGQLKDSVPTNPGNPRLATERQRVIGTGDAIQLATCMYARETLEISDIVFHTFDDGKARNWEGKCVPLLSLERWYPAATRTSLISEVCGLARVVPRHSSPDLATIGSAIVPPSGEHSH